jgi:hypothetical protein
MDEEREAAQFARRPDAVRADPFDPRELTGAASHLPSRWYRGAAQWLDNTELSGAVAGWVLVFRNQAHPLAAPPPISMPLGNEVE